MAQSAISSSKFNALLIGAPSPFHFRVKIALDRGILRHLETVRCSATYTRQRSGCRRSLTRKVPRGSRLDCSQQKLSGKKKSIAPFFWISFFVNYGLLEETDVVVGSKHFVCPISYKELRRELPTVSLYQTKTIFPDSIQ